jgi:hypothetical protein
VGFLFVGELAACRFLESDRDGAGFASVARIAQSGPVLGDSGTILHADQTAEVGLLACATGCVPHVYERSLKSSSSSLSVWEESSVGFSRTMVRHCRVGWGVEIVWDCGFSSVPWSRRGVRRMVEWGFRSGCGFGL